MTVKANIRGSGDLQKKIIALGAGILGNLEVIAKAGLLPVETQAKDNMGDSSTHPEITGTLARSITIEVERNSPIQVTGRVGSNLEYAEIEENREGHSYLGAALDDKINEMSIEATAAARAIVRSNS